MNFTKIFQSNGLMPKNKGHTNFYECCDWFDEKSISKVPTTLHIELEVQVGMKKMTQQKSIIFLIQGFLFYVKFSLSHKLRKARHFKPVFRVEKSQPIDLLLTGYVESWCSSSTRNTALPLIWFSTKDNFKISMGFYDFHQNIQCTYIHTTYTFLLNLNKNIAVWQ